VQKFYNNFGVYVYIIFMDVLSSHKCLTILRKKRYSSPMVKRLGDKAYLLVSNQRTKITYGNFTNRRQSHTPRAAIRGCGTRFRGWSLSERSVFGCGERMTVKLAARFEKPGTNTSSELSITKNGFYDAFSLKKLLKIIIHNTQW